MKVLELKLRLEPKVKLQELVGKEEALVAVLLQKLLNLEEEMIVLEILQSERSMLNQDSKSLNNKY